MELEADAGALAIALLTWWAGYFFHVSHLKVGDGQVVASFPNRPVKVWATKSKAHLNLLVPAGEYFEGLREVALSNRRGRPAWFLGQLYPKGGIKLYYPVAIALKWPTILLLLFFGSLILGRSQDLPRAGRPAGHVPLRRRSFWRSRCSPGLTSASGTFCRCILLRCSSPAASGNTRENIEQRWRSVVLALCLNAADALRYAPDYLSYFNIFVNPASSWRLLTDSNLDWGQGLLALRHYEQQHPNEALHLAYFGSVDPTLYGVRATPLAPEEHVSGTVVAGASCLSGQVLDNSDSYRWLWSYQPRQVLDHALWVFDTEQK